MLGERGRRRGLHAGSSITSCLWKKNRQRRYRGEGRTAETQLDSGEEGSGRRRWAERWRPGWAEGSHM
eukprot:2785964-Lingulodinium_polyedra.AAC.1